MKRFCSLLLCLCLLLSGGLPALAAEGDFEIVDGVLLSYRGNERRVVVPDGVTAIGPQAFRYGNPDVEEIVLPDSVRTIGIYAFSNCASLRTVTLPEGLTVIDEMAFRGCKALASIDLPESLEVLGAGAFLDCTSLKWITTAVDNPVYESWYGVLCERETAALVAYPGGRRDDCYMVPPNITRIGKFAFGKSDRLRELVIPESVTELADEALVLAEGLTIRCAAGSAAQQYAARHHLPFSTFPGDPFEIQDSILFHYRGNEQRVVVPDGVIDIYPRAFCYGNPDMEEVVLPDSVRAIGNHAFANCPSLRTVTLPESLEVLEAGAFDGCSALGGTVTLPPATTTLEKAVFRGCALTGVVFPEGMEEIGEEAFAGCAFETLVLPEGLKRIGRAAFRGCANLKDITMPASITAFSTELFADCTALARQPEMERLTEIGAGAFMGCTALRYARLKEETTAVGEGAFAGCTSLEWITTAENNPVYENRDGVLFERETAALVAYPDGRAGESYTIPADIVRIGMFAFGSGGELRELVIPESVTELDDEALILAEELTIRCTPGSVAHAYAVKEGIPFVLLIEMPGDVDSNGAVDTTDARLTLQYAVEKCALDEKQFATADVNGDGVVNTTDARLILQYAVEKIEQFPAEM